MGLWRKGKGRNKNHARGESFGNLRSAHEGRTDSEPRQETAEEVRWRIDRDEQRWMWRGCVVRVVLLHDDGMVDIEGLDPDGDIVRERIDWQAEKALNVLWEIQ
jgi:hypothetical protein